MASNYPPVLEELIVGLRRLPGVGARTAERLALSFTGWPADDLRNFGALLAAIPERLRFCTGCGNFAEAETCPICADPHRQRDVICIVEQAIS